jgi:hypothetical protein
MGQDLQRRTPGTPSPRPEPSWAVAFGNTLRLWLERHHIISRRPTRRRRLIIVLAALVAMAFGAGITLAFTGPDQAGSSGARPSDAAQSMTSLQQAALYRQQAAVWIKANVTAGVDVSCDYIMCQEALHEGYPSSQLMALPSTASDPLGAELIIATPAIRSQFGTRLASIYAPQVIAKFGSGQNEIDIRYLVPGGSAAYNAQLQANLSGRIGAGEQLLNDTNIQVSSPAVRARLRAGQVDPRLLITLSLLSHKMTVKLVAFSDSSPGEGYVVPLRGLEIGIAPGNLSALLSLLKQQTTYAPAQITVGKPSNGQQVVTIRYGAPGPMNLNGGA